VTTATRPRARKRPAPIGTIEHFRTWAYGLYLDTGDRWELEPFQVPIVRDILSGVPEVWVIIPEGNGKTTLLAGIALYHIGHTTRGSVPVAASSREQAEIMYRQAEGFVDASPDIKRLYKCQEGYRRVKALETGGRMQVFAADDRTADGVIPTLALIDELHRHRDLKLYRTWRGKIEKRGGQVVTISTAGEPGSEFEETRAEILREPGREVKSGGQYVRVKTPDLILHDWGVRRRSEADNMRVVKQANPRRAITPETLRKKRRSKTMSDAHWHRFTCNIATREEGQAVLPEVWDALARPRVVADHEAWSVGWIDLGWRIDCSAIGVLVWESAERRVVPAPVILEPPVDEADIVEALLQFDYDYRPVGWVYDPSAGMQQAAQLLDKGDHPQQGPDDRDLTFFEHSQDNAPMVLGSMRLDEAIRNGWLVHDGDLGLRRHVLNAVRKQVGPEKWRYDRPADAKGARRRKYPIDALSGLLMGNSYAVSAHEDGDPNPYAHHGVRTIGGGE